MDDPWENGDVPWVDCWHGCASKPEGTIFDCEDCKGMGSYPDPKYKIAPCIPETPNV